MTEVVAGKLDTQYLVAPTMGNTMNQQSALHQYAL